MAVHTLGLLLLTGLIVKHLMSDVLVTSFTVVLKNSRVPRDDLYGFMKVLEGEGPGVTEAIVSLRYILPEKIMGQVTVVAGSYRVMTTLYPGVKIGLHHVAVDARLRVCTEIGEPLSIIEGEGSQPEECAE